MSFFEGWHWESWGVKAVSEYLAAVLQALRKEGRWRGGGEAIAHPPPMRSDGHHEKIADAVVAPEGLDSDRKARSSPSAMPSHRRPIPAIAGEEPPQHTPPSRTNGLVHVTHAEDGAKGMPDEDEGSASVDALLDALLLLTRETRLLLENEVSPRPPS